MTLKSAFVLLAGLMTVACSQQDSELEWRVSVNTLMTEELDPAVDEIWLKSGYVLTEEEGEVSLFPKTKEEWDQMVLATDEIIAIAGRLADEPYSRGKEDWVQFSAGLVDAAETAKTAAQARDKEAVFDAGGYLYRVCVACHERYLIQPEGMLEAPR